MDLLIYVVVLSIIGIFNCYRNGLLNLDTTPVEVQVDVGDASLGIVNREVIPVMDGTEGNYEEDAFTKIIKELGLRC